MNAIFLGALFAFFGVAAGAFGAHGLKTRLSVEMLAIFQTGVTYQLTHALALCTFGVLRIQCPQIPSWIGWFFVLGIVLFSGSLYILALSGKLQWGMVTPVGGLAFLVAWASLARYAFGLRIEKTHP